MTTQTSSQINEVLGSFQVYVVEFVLCTHEFHILPQIEKETYLLAFDHLV